MAQVRVRVPFSGSLISGNQITSLRRNLLVQAKTNGKKGGISFPSHITLSLTLSQIPTQSMATSPSPWKTHSWPWGPAGDLDTSWAQVRRERRPSSRLHLPRQLFRSKATASSPAILPFPPTASLRTLTQPWWEVRVSLDNLVLWSVEVNLGEVHDFS